MRTAAEVSYRRILNEAKLCGGATMKISGKTISATEKLCRFLEEAKRDKQQATAPAAQATQTSAATDEKEMQMLSENESDDEIQEYAKQLDAYNTLVEKESDIKNMWHWMDDDSAKQVKNALSDLRQQRVLENLKEYVRNLATNVYGLHNTDDEMITKMCKVYYDYTHTPLTKEDKNDLCKKVKDWIGNKRNFGLNDTEDETEDEVGAQAKRDKQQATAPAAQATQTSAATDEKEMQMLSENESDDVDDKSYSDDDEEKMPMLTGDEIQKRVAKQEGKLKEFINTKIKSMNADEVVKTIKTIIDEVIIEIKDRNDWTEWNRYQIDTLSRTVIARISERLPFVRIGGIKKIVPIIENHLKELGTGIEKLTMRTIDERGDCSSRVAKECIYPCRQINTRCNLIETVDQNAPEMVVHSIYNGYMNMSEDDLKQLKDDRNVVLAAVKVNANALEYASEELKDDKEVVLAAVKKSGNALEYTSKKLKDNREVVLAAVKKSGNALRHASEELQGDKEVVLAALKKSGNAFKYASNTLKDDKYVAKVAMQKRPKNIFHLSKRLHDEQYDKSPVTLALDITNNMEAVEI